MFCDTGYTWVTKPYTWVKMEVSQGVSRLPIWTRASHLVWNKNLDMRSPAHSIKYKQNLRRIRKICEEPRVWLNVRNVALWGETCNNRRACRSNVYPGDTGMGARAEGKHSQPDAHSGASDPWFTQVWSRVLLYVTFVFIVCRCLIQTREHYWLPLAGQELLRVFWTLLALILFFSTVE